MTQNGSVTKRLEGKIAVITGGNSGIGLATAQRFVQEGAYVFITGRRQSELDKTVKQIGTGASPPTGDIGGHTNSSYNHVRIHHFTDALIGSTLCTICLVIATLFMVFLLPSHTSKEQKSQV
jgi:hypothetical protein